MSYIEIYAKLKGNDTWQEVGEIKNATRGAWMLWANLEKKYLPTYKGVENPYIGGYYSRLTAIMDKNAMDEIWNLQNNTELTLDEQIVFRSTMDRTFIKGEHIPLFIEFLDSVGRRYDTNHTDQASVIKKYYDENGDSIEAISYNQTSVCSPYDIFGNEMNIGLSEFSDCMDDNKWDMPLSKTKKS